MGPVNAFDLFNEFAYLAWLSAFARALIALRGIPRGDEPSKRARNLAIHNSQSRSSTIDLLELLNYTKYCCSR